MRRQAANLNLFEGFLFIRHSSLWYCLCHVLARDGSCRPLAAFTVRARRPSLRSSCLLLTLSHINQSLALLYQGLLASLPALPNSSLFPPHPHPQPPGSVFPASIWQKAGGGGAGGTNWLPHGFMEKTILIPGDTGKASPSSKASFCCRTKHQRVSVLGWRQ